MKTTIVEMHKIAQYLAAFNLSFLPQVPDDSHSNLEWKGLSNSLVSRVTRVEQVQLGFNVLSAELFILKSGNYFSKLALQENVHKSILTWIATSLKEAGIEQEYRYAFHYDLPYESFADNTAFYYDTIKAEQITQLWTLAFDVFKRFLGNYQLESEIRIWPHHFDMGVYTAIRKADNLYMGAGLALPDMLVDAMYYYATSWYNNKAVVTAKFKKKDIGHWRKDWNGAVLDATNVKEKELEAFLAESMMAFLDYH